ncbi:hypothetical protein FSP39_022404 [Pinctada imbricata]|uniref:AD domain-containing protein n=1 Tax=Pinctada imbricata TaxID=66713 RepID=A0AA88Y946_PINIB|nr:hypothetical protein FSP39_022404 [Pinctada imbricata]
MAEVINGDQHPIFKCDPEEWMQYVYKQVRVSKDDGTEATGWVYTIDPVTQSFVLVSFLDDKSQMEMVMGPSVQRVTVLDENCETYKKKLDSLFRNEEVASLSEEELEARKNKLKLWLCKNRLPVQVSGNNGEMLSVSDALFIEPPYGPDNCRSTNEIILGRIQGLIKNMPVDQEEW